MLLMLVVLLPGVLASNFLLVSMDQGRSHTGSFQPFMHRLQEQNHTVSLYFNTYKPEIDFHMKNELIDLSEFLSNPFDGEQFGKMVWNSEFSLASQIVPFYVQSNSCKVVLEKRRREFDRLARGNWDLIFADSLFTVCGYGIARLSGHHHVMIHSSDVEAAHGTAKGFHRNYALLPPNFMPYTQTSFDANSFVDRTRSAFDWLGSVVVTHLISNYFMNRGCAFEVVTPYDGQLFFQALSSVLPDFSFAEFNRISSYSFTDMPESLYYPAARTNDFFSYGSYCAPKKTLPNDVEEFVSDPSSQGTIVVAFGTLVPWHLSPPEKLEAFVQVFDNLSEYRIIWSYKGLPIKTAGHVMVSEWIPQNDLLLHEKTVLFISHGGLKSVKEAACSGTPALFMPMFAEQMRNAWLAKNKVANLNSKFGAQTFQMPSERD
ncbi:UDP-glucoronosyl and UDP-glucosyl transferase [Teladorsagia circumcincta]|uniref:UDP-glucuronosyltransferase n=1 Tax=Teladorsagia circumcincta TaxID=45464 RepID=A0A2G9U6L9_TELCI|nr:UDP-glucoronosyl and UDP-glucosyl transferase [Teladorsagia circumcincta]